MIISIFLVSVHNCLTDLGQIRLHATDALLVQGERTSLAELPQKAEFDDYKTIGSEGLTEQYRLKEWTFVVEIPNDSVLTKKSLAESRLGDAFGLQVLAIHRGSETLLVPDPLEMLAAGDRLLVKGKREDLDIVKGLRELEMERETTPFLGVLESEPGSLTEVVLSPRSKLPGKSLREINFRERYGLQALAVWREGRALRSQLRDLPLRFGDALLLLGQPAKFRDLAKDPDFLVLTESVQSEPRSEKGLLSAIIMAVVLLPVLFGYLPISISAVMGVTFMILTKCISMEDAYGFIEWRPIFLISGMLPLGVAMQETGAANFVAEHVVSLVGWMGPWGVIVGLYLITTLATVVVPTAALVLLMGPIVMKTSADMGISEHAVMMAVAMAASASFTSPISHPANVLVMGPGGYKFMDYVKQGVPLTLVIMVIVFSVLNIFWPL